MNNLIRKELTLDSREVAKMMEVNHWEILRKLEGSKDRKGYIEILTDNQMVVSDYFIKSSYKDSSGKENTCYELTRMGCEFLANKFTGEKGVVFTAKYVKRFNQMENALKEVYHISETALTNNVVNILKDVLVTEIDARLAKYEENYRPTHANKISINNYIKKGLGDLREAGEVDLVKDRVLLVLNAEAWQDVPYEKLANNMHLIDESIRAVKSFRTKTQLSLFES